MSIDFSDVYYFEKAGKRGSFSAEYLSTATAADCIDRLARLFRGDEVSSTPVPFCWAEGSRLYDVLLSTLPSDLLSAHCFNVLETAHATGWSRYLIELHGKNDEPIDGYSGLVVTGRCDPPQYDRSRVETRIGASGKPYKVKIGLYFDEATWDGSDVFTPEGTTFVFVTAKVKQALEEAKITGVNFTPLALFERQW